MKTSTAWLFCCVLHANIANTQALRYPLANPFTGLVAYSNKQADPFSFTGNQAAIARSRYTGVALYGERRFLLSETSSYSLAAVFPGRMGQFGLQMNYAGFKNFNENKIGLAYGRSLGSKTDVGIQFNYYGYRVPAYGNASVIHFEAGVIIHFTGQLQGGVHVYNPVGGKFGKTGNEKLPSVYKLGMGYDASENFFTGFEMIKEEDKPVNVVAGFQYHFEKQFFIRAGITSDTASPFGGAGIGWNDLRIYVSVSHHPRLGFSPGILLIMEFKNMHK